MQIKKLAANQGAIPITKDLGSEPPHAHKITVRQNNVTKATIGSQETNLSKLIDIYALKVTEFKLIDQLQISIYLLVSH